MMKTCKSVHLLTVLILISLFMSSCTDDSQLEKENLVILSGTSGSLKWEIEYPDRTYYFSDLLPLSFRLTRGEEDLTVALNPDVSIPWGDFRVYSYTYSTGRLELLLQPVKTGQSLLSIPAFQQLSESIPLMKPVEIKSFLEGTSGELSSLLDVKDQSSRSSLWLILVTAALVLAGVIFLIPLFFRKKPEQVPEESLSDLIVCSESRSYGENDLEDLYRRIYRLLLKDLIIIHPAVLPSDSPAELITHLEMPSPLNQWALRSLYPLLEAMDVHFFHNIHADSLKNRFERDLNTLKEWISFTETLNKEVKSKT